MVKILITSVGSLVGYNILDVLEGRRQGIQIIGTNSSAADANLFRCDQAYLVPPTRLHEEGFRDKLLTIIAAELPDLIIPARDDDLRVLAALRKERPQLADAILCGNENSVAILTDKWLTHQFAVTHNLPIADTSIPNPKNDHKEVRQLLADHGFPLLAKPRYGFASRNVFVITNETQLQHALELQNTIIQPYLGRYEAPAIFNASLQKRGIPLFYSLEGKKYSLQTFVHRNGTVGETCCTLHQMVSGRSYEVEKLVDTRLEEIALLYGRAMGAAGWLGPLNIQCRRLPSGAFVAHELNGRFTGATSARAYLGFDEVRVTLRSLLGVHLKKLQPVAPSRVARYITTLPVADEAVARLQEQGKWQADWHEGS